MNTHAMTCAMLVCMIWLAKKIFFCRRRWKKSKKSEKKKFIQKKHERRRSDKSHKTDGGMLMQKRAWRLLRWLKSGRRECLLENHTIKAWKPNIGKTRIAKIKKSMEWLKKIERCSLHCEKKLNFAKLLEKVKQDDTRTRDLFRVWRTRNKLQLSLS